MSTEEKRDIRYDYDLQVWVINGVVEICGHPDSMRPDGMCCCNRFRYAGMSQTEARVVAGLTKTRNIGR